MQMPRYFASSGASEASSTSSVSSRGSAAVVHEQVARMHHLPALPRGERTCFEPFKGQVMAK